MTENKILSKSWTSCPTELCNIRQTIKSCCTQLCYPENDTNLIVLAIDEACTNIMRYAYKDYLDGEILIEILTTSEQAIFLLHDHAQQVSGDCIKIKKTSQLEPGGLGLVLMNEIMDSVEFVHTVQCPGNILEMKKALPKENT